MANGWKRSQTHSIEKRYAHFTLNILYLTGKRENKG